MIEATQITRTMLPILIFNWILGMGVIQYPVGKPHPTLSYIYSLSCMIGYYALAVVAYPYLFSVTFIYKHTKLPVVVLFYCNVVLILVVIRLNWRCQARMQHYVINSAIVDNLMQNIGIRLNYGKILNDHAGKVILIFSAIVVIIFVNSFLTVSLDTPISTRILLSAIFVYPINMLNISDFTFITYVNFARYRFQKLNRFLESTVTFATTPCNPQNAKLRKSQRIRVGGLNNTEKDYPDFMIIAKRIHLQLTKMCQETDRIYAMNILLSVAITFILLTGNAYVVYTSIYTKKRSEANLAQEIPFSALWTCYYLVKIFLLSFYSHKCEQEFSLTGDLINKIYDEPWISSETQSEIRDFNMQMIQRPLKFSAGGFITLDLSLVQVLIHTITTHLVIMIQLGQVHSDKPRDKINLT